jgi:hypothetical protein
MVFDVEVAFGRMRCWLPLQCQLTQACGGMILLALQISTPPGIMQKQIHTCGLARLQQQLDVDCCKFELVYPSISSLSPVYSIPGPTGQTGTDKAHVCTHTFFADRPEVNYGG